MHTLHYLGLARMQKNFLWSFITFRFPRHQWECCCLYAFINKRIPNDWVGKMAHGKSMEMEYC